VKYSLFEPEEAWAVAPRLGAGAAYADQGSVLMTGAGLIGSYRAAWIEPYVGATFANHWVHQPAPTPLQELGPGEKLAERTGIGDGVVALTIGLALRFGNEDEFLVEYSRWQPAQNDPGDNYAFVGSNIFAAGMHFGAAPGK
jgi:hypothetical protein